MIPAVEVTRVKNGTNLVALIQSKGIDLQKKGRSWQGRCPFHADGKTPSLSVTPEKGLWKCFGCNADGDAIRFLEMHDKLNFREAAIRLGAKAAAPLRLRAVESAAMPPALARPRYRPPRRTG